VIQTQQPKPETEIKKVLTINVIKKHFMMISLGPVFMRRPWQWKRWQFHCNKGSFM